MGIYTEKSNLLAKQSFYEEMAPDDISRSFFIDKNGSAIGWRMIRANGTRLSYDAGNRGFFPFDVLPDDKAINLPPYDYIDGKIVSLGKEQSVTLERPESFYLGATKVLQTPDGFMCQLSAADNKEIASLTTELKDTSEHRHEVMKFVTRCDEVELVHVTTEDRLGSILETGIRPSAYGDMAVVGDDGAGVYAVRNDARLIHKVLDDVVDTETLGHVYAVKFRYKGRYVECVDSVEHSSQGGYILIPKAACPHGIPAKDIIGYTRLTPQEQSVEKASLGDQIRQAEARTTPINAEKETHNIEQDRR